MRRLEWLELVKKWVDEQRLDEENKQKDRHCHQPKIKPPASRAPPNHAAKNRDEKRSNG